MSTAFGVTPQTAKGVPAPSIVPRERIYGVGKPQEPPQAPSVEFAARLASQRDLERQEAIAAAWEAGFRAAELMHGTKVIYDVGPKVRTVSVRKIVDSVAKKHGLTVEAIMGDQRKREIVDARHEAMWRCSKETSFSLARIGREFGNKDHTTVMNAIKRHEQRMAKEAKAG